MKRIIYRSVTMVPFTAAELRYLVMRSARRNGERGISGILVYADGLFLQALEGDAAAVADLLNLIAADERHAEVLVLSDTTIERRGFDGWSLGLATASREELVAFADRIAASRSPEDADGILAALKQRIRDEEPG